MLISNLDVLNVPLLKRKQQRRIISLLLINFKTHFLNILNKCILPSTHSFSKKNWKCFEPLSKLNNHPNKLHVYFKSNVSFSAGVQICFFRFWFLCFFGRFSRCSIYIVLGDPNNWRFSKCLSTICSCFLLFLYCK